MLIVETYQLTGSVWKAGKSLGMTGQAVHRTLKRLDIPTDGHGRPWTHEDDGELGRLLNTGLTYLEIGQRLSRPFRSVSIRAGELGVTPRRVQRKQKIPRGVGYDKKSLKAHWGAFLDSGMTLNKYVKSVSLQLETFTQAMQRQHLADWQKYVEEKFKDVPRRQCPECLQEFPPVSARQVFCTRVCSVRHNADKGYFGGRRKETIGLEEGICQLCGNKPLKGISSHHVYGKENDHDNDHLIALCQGCHHILTFLSRKTWCTDARKLEALISFCYMRVNGPRLMAAAPGEYVYAEVIIEEGIEEDES